MDLGNSTVKRFNTKKMLQLIYLRQYRMNVSNEWRKNGKRFSLVYPNDTFMPLLNRYGPTIKL